MDLSRTNFEIDISETTVDELVYVDIAIIRTQLLLNCMLCCYKESDNNNNIASKFLLDSDFLNPCVQ